jgi:multidrug efflux system membrane fusion protein
MSHPVQAGSPRGLTPKWDSGTQPPGNNGEPGGKGPGGRRSWRWWAIGLGAAVVLLGGGYLLRGYWFGGADGKGKVAAGAPPRLIRVATVEVRPVAFEVDAVGAVEPIRTVAIRSRVDGHVTDIRVTPGDRVREGQVLLVLDERPIRATLDQARAAQGRDLAALQNAMEDVDRQVQLMAKQLTTQEAFDRAKSAMEVQKQALEVSKAAVESAKLNLEFATIRAPISGRIGKPTVDIGSIVRAGDSAAIVTINQIHPIYATFAVPQRYLDEIRGRFGKEPLAARVTRPGNSASPSKGVLSFVDNTVDPTTGTIVLRATCENQAELLWPGESVSVVLTLSTEPNALVVPPEAVQTGPRGTFVYVTKPDNTVEYRPVKVDRVVANSAVVSSGLQAGEQVVLDGQLNLVNGARIQVLAANIESGKKP